MTLSKAKKRAWDAFSKYIRLRDALKTTGDKDRVNCYSCRKEYPSFGKGCVQAGHFIPGRGNSVLIDEIGVNAQCYNCNVNLKGNWVNYERYLIQEYGNEAVQGLKDRKKEIVKMKVFDWNDIEKKYKDKFNELNVV